MSLARRASLRADVSDAVDLSGRFEIAVDLVAPASAFDAQDVTVLACLPGGFLSRRYFDLGCDMDRRYSFAEAMAQRGYVTLAFDHLGVGESSKPVPLEAGYALGVEAIAAANQRALELVLARLAQGDIAPDLPPMRVARTFGVGHSMGSALTVEQQALSRPHTALVLFSFTTRGTPAFLDDEQLGYANDPERARRELGTLTRRTMGSPYPARAKNSEADRRAAFGVGTAPAAAESALHEASTDLLALGGLLSMIPGGYAPSAEKIDVPTFILIGDHDLHTDEGVRAELPGAPEVTIFTLRDCWHCHFVANTRATLWRRVGDWIQEVVDKCPR